MLTGTTKNGDGERMMMIHDEHGEDDASTSNIFVMFCCSGLHNGGATLQFHTATATEKHLQLVANHRSWTASFFFSSCR